MKFFIGARNLNGQVAIAEIVEASDFDRALKTLRRRAEEEIGASHLYRLTAVNEVSEHRLAEFGARKPGGGISGG